MVETCAYRRTDICWQSWQDQSYKIDNKYTETKQTGDNIAEKIDPQKN